MSLPPGSRLGPYEIVAPLGAGGMGEVYKARDAKLDRFVAIKILPAARVADAAARERFQREARAIAALAHPNIVTVHAFEEHAGSPFLAMEFIEGETLADMIPEDGSTVERFLAVAIPLADAVAAAHARGIMHRDLKPANIMFTADGRLKVLDFGLARLTETAADTTSLPTEQLTDRGQVMGTAAYMSPEQAEGKLLDQRSDIFSLGVILYELATGRRPFEGDSTAAVLSAILRDTPPPVTELNAALPREISRLVRRCLEKDPAQRLHSAVDLRHELEDLRAEQTHRAGAASATAAAGNRSSGVLAVPAGRYGMVAAALVVAALGGWAWSLRPATGGAPTPRAPETHTLTVGSFDNRTGDPGLDAVGPFLVNAITREFPQFGFLQKTGASGPRVSAAVNGSYFLDGDNLRMQASLTGADGNAIYTMEPVVVARSESSRGVELVRERMLGAIVAYVDPLFGAASSRPPLYSAQLELNAAFELFIDEPARALEHIKRAIALDADYFDAWWVLAMTYSVIGDRDEQARAVERMRAMRERIGPRERAYTDYAVAAMDRRLLDALRALRRAEDVDPTNIGTKFMIADVALSVNQPQAAIEVLAKVNAEQWNEHTLGRNWHSRVTLANHLLDRHQEELTAARASIALYPTALNPRNEELFALAALGRVDEMNRSVDSILGLARSGNGTHGGSIRLAAEELRAHGHRSESIKLAKRALEWYRSRPAELQGTNPIRIGYAQTLYVAEQWAEAGKAAVTLLKTQPTNASFLGLAGASAARIGDRGDAARHDAALAERPPAGGVLLRRAQIASLLGERERAVQLLRDAFAAGLPMSGALHRQMDFEPLKGYPPFDELMRPKG